jgi:hypothetical protein
MCVDACNARWLVERAHYPELLFDGVEPSGVCSQYSLEEVESFDKLF